MAIAAAMALVCYVSSNPSPQHWLVSGKTAEVVRLDAQAARLGGVRRIAHARDGDTAFSRYELGANPPNRVMWELISQAERSEMVISRFQHIVPSCPDGQRSRIGDAQSNLIVGLLGPAPAATAEKLGLQFRLPPPGVRLADGRTGIGFRLRTTPSDAYDVLLRAAAEARLGGTELVLMQPKGAAGPMPDAEPTRRPDQGHRAGN
jgi:hypothetical protein